MSYKKPVLVTILVLSGKCTFSDLALWNCHFTITIDRGLIFALNRYRGFKCMSFLKIKQQLYPTSATSVNLDDECRKIWGSAHRLLKISIGSMVIRREKILSQWSILLIKKEKIFTDGSMLLVVSMTDSIERYYRYPSNDPSPIIYIYLFTYTYRYRYRYRWVYIYVYIYV
jgi:hypothetical protein